MFSNPVEMYHFLHALASSSPLSTSVFCADEDKLDMCWKVHDSRFSNTLLSSSKKKGIVVISQNLRWGIEQSGREPDQFSEGRGLDPTRGDSRLQS